MKDGILVALMGVTNVGKTTQNDLLLEFALKNNMRFASVKYPVYDLAPSGPRVHRCLKEGNPDKLTAFQLQQSCAQNRRDFEPQLKKLLEENDIVIVEMYTATGYCFGMAEGVAWSTLKELNEGLIVPHVSILLDGERFIDSIEKGHRFEEDFVKTEVVRNFHLLLAEKYGWYVVKSDKDKMSVHDEIINIIASYVLN